MTTTSDPGSEMLARLMRGVFGLCIGLATTGACTARSVSTPIVAPGDTSVPSVAAAPGCPRTPTKVQALVDRFIESYNAGDQRTLEQIWARPGRGWQWYSTDGPDARLNDVAKDRASLPAFFARRHSQHETLRLTSFQVNGQRGDFEFTLIRAADDILPTPFRGKGAAACGEKSMTLIVWSMGAINP